jgi:hypothetical protein
MKQVIYTTLDTLLDTRIATISRIDQEAAVKLVSCDGYYTRLIDDFTELCGIDKATFDEAYAARDVETLKQARPTNCIVALHTLVEEFTHQQVETPYVGEIEVVVNTWPYKLSGEERGELERTMSFFTGMETQNSLVWIPLDQLTPTLIKRTYSGMIMYDFSEWAQIHGEALVHCMMPDVTILAPALFKGRIPTPEETVVPTLPTMNPFELTEFMLVASVSLNLLDVGYFTLIRL